MMKRDGKDSHLLCWAGQRPRSGSDLRTAEQKARAAIAAAKRRRGGQFVKAGVKTVLPVRSQAQRAERDIETLKKKFDKFVTNTKTAAATLIAQHSSSLITLNARLAVKDEELEKLKKAARTAARTRKPTYKAGRERLLHGGSTLPTKLKLAKRLETLLAAKFATPAARKQALYEHFLRHPDDYYSITSHGVTRPAFDQLCKDNKAWLIPIQQDVIDRIEKEWSLAKMLSLQIHCKVGGAEKYQHMINILAKNYNEEARKWIPKELYEGSGVYLPMLKSKNGVIDYRAAIIAENPLIQDEHGTAVWLDLDKLVDEVIRDDRTQGYLQARTELDSDTVWLHWGGDAAGWLRGLKHSKYGFKLVGNGRRVAQSPSCLKCILLFEGKDNYANYLEYLAPFFPVIEKLRKEGVKVDNTHYHVKQTFGADYVLLSEIMGHSGASGLNGCCLCEQLSKDYGRVITDSNRRRVPFKAKMRTTESMAAAAHRPYTTGPDIKCPYCDEPFPDKAAVKASVPPQNEKERTRFQQTHAGMRFGTPPLFPNIAIPSLIICILHTLLRLCAITFQRTIVVNLDTEEKVLLVNEVIKQVKLGCKALDVRKHSGDQRKVTEAVSFTGR